MAFLLSRSGSAPLCIIREPEFLPCHCTVSRAKDLQFDTIRDHFRCHDPRSQHGLVDFIHKPLGGSDDIQSALSVDLRLALPVVGRRIPPDRRMDRESRAVSAPRLPAPAIKGVSAVAGKEPGVMEGEHGRNLMAEGGEGTKIEVATVEVSVLMSVGRSPDLIRSVPGSQSRKRPPLGSRTFCVQVLAL